MKKFLFLVIGCVLCVNMAVAKNNNREKPNDYIRATAGTWGLGYQAMVLNRNDIAFQSGLFAKYNVTDRWALRGNLRFGRDWATGAKPKYISNEVGSAGNYDYQVDKSSVTIRKSNFMLVFGAEHRHKLSNRFVGYYGMDLGVGAYGQIRRERDSGGDLVSVEKQNRSVDLALQPFVGLEFFVGPQISFSLEAGYDVLFKFYSKNKYDGGIGHDVEERRQYNSIASHVDFGNVVFGTARVTLYF